MLESTAKGGAGFRQECKNQRNASLSDADFCVGNVWVTQSFFVVHAIFVRAP